MPRTKTTPMDFIVTALTKDKAVSYGDLKAAADKKRLTVYPIMYGRAKALLGLVKSAPRGQGKGKLRRAAAAAAGPRETKSDRIRALLSSGMNGPEIAKQVGCAVNLVYAVKARQPSNGRSTPGPRPRLQPRSNGSLDALMAEVRDMVRERDALRRTLEQVTAKLAGVV